MKKIRLIHNLPRTGGTIISKCIGAQRNVILLSEIHEQGELIRKKMGSDPDMANPLKQALKLSNFFNDKEKEKIQRTNYNFKDKINLIYEKAENNGKKLVIRDWSYIDFIGLPFSKPIYQNSLIKKLEKDYEIKNIYILRHPLENFFSINSLKIFNNKIPLDFFLKSYSLFFKEAARDRTYSYEKFTLDPDKDLKKICNNIEIEFDKKYLNNIGNFEITGDHKANSSNTVLPNEDKIMNFINEEILLKIKKNKLYRNLIDELKDFYSS